MHAPILRSIFVVVLVLAGISCRDTRPAPLELQGAQLQISNDTVDNWTGVEVWLNRYFRATVSSIPAHSRYMVPLNAFVSGYAQRFDFNHMQITALSLTGKRPDGSPVEITKQFDQGGLAGALGGKQ